MVDAESSVLWRRYLQLAVGLGAFLAASYLVCSLWDAAFPRWAMRAAWAPLLPGFTWWSWGSFFVGLVESIAYGFWIALVIPAIEWSRRLFARAVPPAV